MASRRAESSPTFSGRTARDYNLIEPIFLIDFAEEAQAFGETTNLTVALLGRASKLAILYT